MTTATTSPPPPVYTYDGKFAGAVVDRWPFQQRMLQMANEHQSWVPALKELAQFCNPTRGFFPGSTANDGKKIDHKIVLDGHPRRCVRTLASGMVSGLTSPSRPWFRLGLGDTALGEYPLVKQWLDLVQTILLDIYAHSNIYGVLHTAYEEIATFGTACFFLEEDPVEVIRGRVYTAGEYFLSCGPDGKVNGFGRKFQMTVDQLVKKFGIEHCSMAVRNFYESNQRQNWISVCHLIETNTERVPGMADFKNMAYRSLYWEDASQEKTFLSLGGYEEWPVLSPRWETTTTMDVYGRGPGWDSLGDAKMLQKEQRVKLLALDKVGDPPIQVDASVQGEPNTLPGGVTRFSAALPNAGIKPAYQVAPDINGMRQEIMDVKKAISESFYADLFLLLNQADFGRMTAYEVAERQSEKLVVLGPVLERLENEMLSPLIKRTYAIALRMGLIPPPPPEIQGLSINIEFISVMAQAQRMVGGTAIQQTIGFATSLAAIKPGVEDNLDGDAILRDYSDRQAVPAKYLVDPAKVEEMRKARAEAAAAQAQADQAVALAKAGKDGAAAASDLGNTPVGTGSVLDKMTESAGR
jgi:hypothetical protein